MKINRFFIVFIIVFIVISILLSPPLSRPFFLNKFKSFLINTVESSTQKGVKIESISYVPVKGIRLSGISLYNDLAYSENVLRISSLYMKFSVIDFLMKRIFSPTISINDLRLENTRVDGRLGFSLKLGEKIKNAGGASGSIERVWFDDISIKNAFLNIGKLNASFDITPALVKSSQISFALNGEPCKAHFEVRDPLEKLSLQLELSSSLISLASKIAKEGEIYKISLLKGVLLNSPFAFTGEFEIAEEPILSVYGESSLYVKDIVYFIPEEAKSLMQSLGFEGILGSAVYFKGNPKNIRSCEVGIKSDSELLRLAGFKFNQFHMETRIKDGIITIPILSAYPYGGALTSSMTFNFTDKNIPYKAGCKLNNIDIASLVRDSSLKWKEIGGRLSSEIAIEGNAKDDSTMQGSGALLVKNGDLGPMPLLTPLVGNIYGYFRNIFPGLQGIDITDGSANFRISNRKVSTDNLTLWGQVVTLYARGYVDFSGNLDFEVENKVKESGGSGSGDFQSSIEEMMVQVGKVMSKARLTGTVRKPEWKFQYLGGVQNILKGGLGSVLKDIFE